jgi:hypothetical protein
MRDNFLWKPIAEHYNGLAVVTLPRASVRGVVVRSLNGTAQRVRLPFRSRGSAGDAWSDYNRTGAQYQKEFGAVRVEVRRYEGRMKTYQLNCPRFRSDGLNKTRTES